MASNQTSGIQGSGVSSEEIPCRFVVVRDDGALIRGPYSTVTEAQRSANGLNANSTLGNPSAYMVREVRS